MWNLAGMPDLWFGTFDYGYGQVRDKSYAVTLTFVGL